ncbi:unnamed protein product, partial [Laminaria digitata]
RKRRTGEGAITPVSARRPDKGVVKHKSVSASRSDRVCPRLASLLHITWCSNAAYLPEAWVEGRGGAKRGQQGIDGRLASFGYLRGHVHGRCRRRIEACAVV